MTHQSKINPLTCCPVCGAGQDSMRVIERPIEQLFRGETFEIQGKVLACSDCGYETMEPSEPDALVHATWAAYRKRFGLLESEAIIRFRKDLELTQDRFAELLGVGVASVKRWEKGLVQDKAMDELIRSKMQLHQMQAYSAETAENTDEDFINAAVEQMTQSIVRAAQPERVILFGSHAKGNATSQSDYDFALIFNNKGQLRGGLRSANKALWPRKHPVDLVALTTDSFENGSSLLAREISSTGRIVYDSSIGVLNSKHG